ncbi:MAG: hypothetical protein OEM85_03595 [Gammaproteobacteria bacterium]|nr:hypothetical protein [Gammaproteobacteria bacterium]MDH3372438.1 hypothetical protein [Gammaproteobacteria bacterium]MDH3410476.1 hypothetical protein [Gammaproteobacteria bacterium]
MNRYMMHLLVGTVLALGLAISGAASADGFKNGCSIQGTWYGVNNFDDKELTGWVVSVSGKSEKNGTNALEYPTFDSTFGGLFPTAHDGSVNRGVWKRTGGNTFTYSFMTVVVDVNNNHLYSMRTSGDVVIGDNCMTETITATFDFFYPDDNPFEDEPFYSQTALDPHYGYRFTLD